MTVDIIPTYVYRSEVSEMSLLQGDILKVEGQFRQYFTDFYPAVTHSEDENKNELNKFAQMEKIQLAKAVTIFLKEAVY